MTTLGLLQRQELQTLARTLHERALNVNKHVEDNYLLARPFEERAPAGQAISKEREVIMRLLEARAVPSYILDPEDWPRIIWDVAASVLIMTDIFYVPFMIAFFSSTSWYAQQLHGVGWTFEKCNDNEELLTGVTGQLRCLQQCYF
jgi:hypothetical protein